MNPREEHLATRRAAGLFDFSFMGLFEFHGPPPRQSRDLSAIEPGRAAYTLLLNDDGSVFNDATVWNMGADRWWLFTGRPGDVSWLGSSARNRSGEHAILALQGPASGRILARLIGADAVRSLRYFRFRERPDMLIARLGYSGELGYELLVPAADEPRLRAKLMDAGHADGLVECSFEAANTLRIESGYVLFDREIDSANPRELGLERLAPNRQFELTRKLIGLEITSESARAALGVARITSECDSPTLGKRIALGFAAPDTKPGDGVKLNDGRFARIAKLPFYDPGRHLLRAAPL